MTCFVALPLRFSFERPAADGVCGLMFDVLAGFDQPFNQAPSLHIALLVILWSLYRAQLAGLARHAMDALFFLICASVLTTYQHHFIDVPTGAAARLALRLGVAVRGRGPRRRCSRSGAGPATRSDGAWPAVTLLGARVAAVLAVTIGGWGLWLFWVSALAAAGRRRLCGPRRRRLRQGCRWPSHARGALALAPYLAAAWINSRLWTARDPAPVAIADGVWLGRIPTARELAASPFAGVVDLTAEFDLRAGARDVVSVPVLDLTAPARDELAHAADAIERLRARGPVLVCCALGYSRSACAVAAWLLATGRAPDVASALATIRRARTRIVLGERHVAALAALAPGVRA